MLEKHLVETELKFEILTLEYESAKADLEKINIMLRVVQFLGQTFVGMKKGKGKRTES